jgi:adenylate kinase
LKPPTLIVEELERGELVDDTIVSAVVFDNLSETGGGFVLDGFPRTVRQAKVTEEWGVARGLPLDAVIELQVPREELVHRIERRAVDTPRSDDALRTVLYRLDGYDRESSELLAFYRERGLLVRVHGTGDVDAVTRRLQAQIDRVLEPWRNGSETR